MKEGPLSTLGLTEDMISVQDSSLYANEITEAHSAPFVFRTEVEVDGHENVA